MAGPKTQNWRALENEHKPKGLHLIVFGQVEVERDQAPVLTESPSNLRKICGFNRTSGIRGSAQRKVWKPAHFHKVVKANQYENVIVRWNATRSQTSHSRRSGVCGQGGRRNEGAQRAARRQGQGETLGKKPAAKKAAAKKAAPTKKSAAKKKPAKAKKAAKKVAKKAAKKKTAKKSAFKKMMGRLVKKLTPAKKKKRR